METGGRGWCFVPSRIPPLLALFSIAGVEGLYGGQLRPQISQGYSDTYLEFGGI